MRHNISRGENEHRTSQQDIIDCDYLLRMFNTCSNLDTFTNHVIQENLRENGSLKEQSEKIFKVLSRIAGGDDKQLTDEHKEKLQESGFFMKLVDKLLELIYSAAEWKRGYDEINEDNKTFAQEAAEKVMSWTCHSALRNRSVSFIESLEDERTKLELGFERGDGL